MFNPTADLKESRNKVLHLRNANCCINSWVDMQGKECDDLVGIDQHMLAAKAGLRRSCRQR